MMQQYTKRDLHDFLCRASMGLMYAEMAGVSIDIAELDRLTEVYLESLEQLEKDLKPWVDNPRSWMQVKAALHEMNYKVNSTDQDTLEHLLERIDKESEANEFISTLLRHRREQKLFGTYVKGARKRLRRGRLHTSFLLHGTTTGRLSSRNPNLQNVPRGSLIRRLYVPEPGSVFVQADYSQVELRVAATHSGDEYLKEVFNDASRDIFDELGHKLYGDKVLGPDRKELRIRTKAYVYGVGYGREAKSIADEYRISIREAQEGLDAYFEMVPTLAAWRQKIMEQILDDSQPNLTTVFGRERRFWLVTRDNKHDVLKEGLAFVPQSTASDINLLAATRMRLDHRLDVRILVHDSTLVSAPRSEADQVADRMSKIMSETATEVMGDFCPFPVEVSIGESWGDV